METTTLTWIYTLLSILFVSLMALSGIVLLILKVDSFKRFQHLLVSFAIGSLLGGAILHLIPESFEHSQDNKAPLLVLVSIVIFFILEKYLHIIRHYYPHDSKVKSFGPLNLFADAMHNFLDGILIAAAYKIDPHTGFIATLAVLAHEIPQEIGDFAVLVQAGYSRKKALLFNFISALSAFLGGILILIFPQIDSDLSQYILPLAAGGFIYIALADLIPELNIAQSTRKSVSQVIALILGILIMWLLLDIHFLHH